MRVCFYLLPIILSCQTKTDKIILNDENEMNITVYKDSIKNLKQYQNQFFTINNLHEMKIKNISYGAYMNSSNVQFEVLINDVPIFRYFDMESKNGMGINGRIPLNSHLLHSGKHIIQGKIYPKYGDSTLVFHSFLSLDISVREAKSLDNLELISIKTPKKKYENEDIINPIKGLPYYELKTELEVELPFDIIGWRNSVNLKDENENGHDISKETHQKITEIREIIAKRDVNQFSNLIKEREALLETAFYFTKDEANQGLNDFLELIKDTTYELAPLPENANLHFYGYGKLITLLTPEREGVIALVNKNDPKDKIVLDFYFHRKQKGKPLEVIL